MHIAKFCPVLNKELDHSYASDEDSATNGEMINNNLTEPINEENQLKEFQDPSNTKSRPALKRSASSATSGSSFLAPEQPVTPGSQIAGKSSTKLKKKKEEKN